MTITESPHYQLGLQDARIERLQGALKEIRHIAKYGTRNTAAWHEVEEVATRALNTEN